MKCHVFLKLMWPNWPSSEKEDPLSGAQFFSRSFAEKPVNNNTVITYFLGIDKAFTILKISYSFK